MQCLPARHCKFFLGDFLIAASRPLSAPAISFRGRLGRIWEELLVSFNLVCYPSQQLKDAATTINPYLPPSLPQTPSCPAQVKGSTP